MATPMKDFVVVDVDGSVKAEGWSVRASCPKAQKYHSLHDAQQIAMNMAKLNPGRVVGIYALVTEVMVPVGDMQVIKVGEG